MSKKLISSNDSESSKALFGTIIENQHIQSTVINDLSDRLDKMDTRIDSLGTSGDINTNNALIQNDLSVKKDTNDSAVGYKTVLGNDMDLGVGKFQSKFLRGNGSGLFSSNVNAIYYDLWSPVINTDPLVPPHHVRLIHPEIKLAHQTPSYTSENVGNYNTFQIGPLGTSNIDSTGSIITGSSNNNYFTVNLRENVESTNILSVKIGSVFTANNGPNISFENVSPDVGSSPEVAYIGAQVLTDNTGDQGSLVFKTLKTTTLTDTDTGSITVESVCNERLIINQHGAVGVYAAFWLPTPDFGLPGAVFTSNGGWMPPTWNRPYFIKVKLTEDNTQTGTNGTARVSNMSVVDFGTGFNYNGTADWANDEWTCPQTGVYRVSLQLGVQSTDTDQAYYAGALLELRSGANTEYIFRHELSTSTDDDSDQVYLSGTTIRRFEQDDDLRLIIGWAVNSGSVKARGGSVQPPDNEDKTFLQIERII